MGVALKQEISVAAISSQFGSICIGRSGKTLSARMNTVG